MPNEVDDRPARHKPTFIDLFARPIAIPANNKLIKQIWQALAGGILNHQPLSIFFEM